MGHEQNVWGEENVPENAPSRKILDPSKRASGLLSRGFFVQEKQSNDTRAGWKTYRARGVGEVSFVRFSSRLFFSTPPWHPLKKRQSAHSRGSEQGIQDNVTCCRVDQTPVNIWPTSRHLQPHTQHADNAASAQMSESRRATTLSRVLCETASRRSFRQRTRFCGPYLVSERFTRKVFSGQGPRLSRESPRFARNTRNRLVRIDRLRRNMNQGQKKHYIISFSVNFWKASGGAANVHARKSLR